MPLSPLRSQFQVPGPQIPGQAVTAALGGQGPLGPTGSVQASVPMAQPQQEMPNPQHEALKRMLGMQPGAY